MSLSIPSSQNIPIWVTTRNSDGSLSNNAIPGLTLSVGAGNPQPITWDGGFGVCSYPLTTTSCPTPQAFSIISSSGTVTSTLPSSIPGLLPTGVTPLSNVVTSQTCLHFISINPKTNSVSLASFRPLDFVAQKPNLIVWSDLPSGITATSFYLSYGAPNLSISFSTSIAIETFIVIAPEHINGNLQTPTAFGSSIVCTTANSEIITVILVNGFPYIIYGVPSAINFNYYFWTNDPSKTNTPYHLDALDGAGISGTSFTNPSNTPQFWFAGFINNTALLANYPIGGEAQIYQPPVYAIASWNGISVTPSEIFLSCDNGLYSIPFNGTTYTQLSDSPCKNVLATTWALNDPWNPLSGDPTPITLGVQIIVPENLTLTNSLLDTPSNLLTTEHFCYAVLEEIPAWVNQGENAPISGSSLQIPPTPTIPPSVLNVPIWDDRVVFNAPSSLDTTSASSQEILIPSPPFLDVTLPIPAYPLDPTGSLIISQSLIPSTQRVSGGFNLIANSQIYQAYYPNTKMVYPELSIVAPIPSVPYLDSSLFPPYLLQAEVGTQSGNSVQAFKAVQVNGQIYVSLIAENTGYVNLGVDTLSLPPVLIDYEYTPPLGSSNVTAILYNQESSLVIETPILKIS